MRRSTSRGGRACGALLSFLPLALGCQSRAGESSVPTFGPSQSLEFGGPGFQAPAAIAVSPDLVTVAGAFSEGFEYQATRLSGLAGIDGFVLGVSPEGELRFLRQLSGSGDDAILAAEQDQLGRSVVAGRVTQGAELDGRTLTDRGDWSALLARLDASGQLEWAVSSSGVGLHSMSAVALDEDGSVYAAGSFTGELMLAGQSLRARSNSDAFLARFSEQGELLWLRGVSGSGPQDIQQLAVDADGTILVAGRYGESLDVAGERRFAVLSFDYTPFVARFQPNGELSWLQTGLVTEPEHDHSDHPPGLHFMQTALGSVALTPELSGELSVVVTHGRFFGLHGGDFEAPAISTMEISRVAASGGLLARTRTDQPNSLLQVGTLLSTADGSRLAASWSGEIEIAGQKMVAVAPRSLLLSQLAESGTLSAPHQFGVAGVSLTAQDAAAFQGSIWVTARWMDLASDEHDVFVARFELY
jgi:hypothetical protein